MLIVCVCDCYGLGFVGFDFDDLLLVNCDLLLGCVVWNQCDCFW